jgi:transcriptional regulator NrdR family protein
MTKVIKRNGKKVPFDPKKIRRSIKKAVIDSGSSLEKKRDVIERISNYLIESSEQKDKIETKEIRMKALVELEKADPAISGAWLRFDKKYKSIEK